ncbi:MAG: AMP-binding protein [Bacteriovorax sp.]|nr:AMP-binding protein [Bacteriovorax sp.]
MINLNHLSSITQVESGEHMSSFEFQQKILEKIENFKSQYGIGPGISVLLLQNNTIEFFINLLAVFKLGATAIPLDPNSSNLEIENIKLHSSISLVIDKNDEKFESLKYLKKLEKIALILYTSGTTGSPKGVMISYNSLDKKMKIMTNEISANDCAHTLCALPTYFGHGLICNSLFAIFHGKEFFIAKKFDLILVRDIAKIINKYGITFFSTVPSVWELILNFSSKGVATPTLRRVHCASSPLSDTKAGSIKNWLGESVSFYNVYGITEMLGWVASNLIEIDSSTNEFKNFWSVEKKNGVNDELLLRSEFMFNGYLDNESAFHEVITSDGFFRTGDIFENGQLGGRLKQIINKKGLKIYPQEINEFLNSSGFVNDVHTFSIPDDFSNELVGVIVSLKKGSTIMQLKEFCNSFLPVSKIPDKFFVQELIVRNSRGKIGNDYVLQLIKGNQTDEK